MKSKIIFILFFVLSQFSLATEYICWQQADFPGIAFESRSQKCENKTIESGKASTQPEENKKIICMMPAMCLALSNTVIEILKKKTGLDSIEKIKNLDSKLIQGALMNTPYIGRASQLSCEGTGTTGPDQFNKLALTQAKCPNFSACANSDEVFYNMSLNAPETQYPFRHIEGTSPVKTIPNSGAQ